MKSAIILMMSFAAFVLFFLLHLSLFKRLGYFDWRLKSKFSIKEVRLRIAIITISVAIFFIGSFAN